MRIVLVAAMAALALVGCSSSSEGSPAAASAAATTTAEPTSFTMTIMGKIAAGRSEAGPDGCQGSLFLSGIRGGAYISITDAAGTTVGAGNLEAGTLNAAGECVLYAYPEVKLGSDFYNISISNRDPITRAAIEARNEGVGIGYGY